MDNRLKNVLGVVSLIALLAFSYTGIRLAGAYAKATQPSSFKSFTVTGEGKVTAIPDIAQFSFSVITEGDKDLSSLQQVNTEKTNKIIGYLKNKKIEEKDIKTTEFNVEPRYQYYNCKDGGVCPPPVIFGYTVRQTVLVKARDFKVVGELLAGVVNNGANSVSQLNFTLDNKDKVTNEAKAMAISKAKERAEAMAKAGGFRLGDLISIDDNGGSSPAMPMMAYGGAMSENASLKSARVSPDIQAGSQEITNSVILRYEIR